MDVSPQGGVALVGAGIEHRENSTMNPSRGSATRTVKQTLAIKTTTGRLTARERDMMDFTPSTGKGQFEDQKGLGGCRIQ